MGEQVLRIIAGKHRGRKLAFRPAEGVRPTGDRIRETLFNWLQPVITGARCLDMFAGSGLLGIEALSRGASEVVFIENQQPVYRQLLNNIETLAVEHATVISGDAFSCLDSIDQTFDIVFIDPPFHRDLLDRAVERLSDGRLLSPAARIYLESEQEVTDGQLPAGWEVIRAKKSGQVFYHLVSVT